MKTPTRAPLFAEVSDRTPAIPASTATTSDHLSGEVMKPVCGRSALEQFGAEPAQAAADEGGAARSARSRRRSPTTSVIAARRAPAGRPCTTATASAASGTNSGPSTIAPMVRIAESLMIAIAASSIAMVRKAR